MQTVNVRTSVFNEGLIVTEVISDIGTSTQAITRKVLNVQDQQIREALIKLGWTPPPGK